MKQFKLQRRLNDVQKTVSLIAQMKLPQAKLSKLFPKCAYLTNRRTTSTCFTVAGVPIGTVEMILAARTVALLNK